MKGQEYKDDDPVHSHSSFFAPFLLSVSLCFDLPVLVIVV